MEPRPLRILFMGTPEFAVPSLEALARRSGDTVVGVVTRPDRPVGRGRRPEPPPVKVAAERLGIPVLQPGRLSDIRPTLENLAPDLIVVVAFGKILKPWLLALPPLGCINVHASLLPELRGAAPIAWAIIRGYRRTGVTVMQMDEGMDTGPILLQREEPIRPDDTAGSLGARLAVLGAEALLEALDLLRRGEAVPRPQDPAKATYARMLRKEDGRIDWTLSPEALDAFVRGMTPWPGAHTTVAGEPLRVLRVAEAPAPGATAVPGTVLRLDREGPVVACGDGMEAVVLRRVQPAGRKEMDGGEYVRGRALAVGDVLGTEG